MTASNPGIVCRVVDDSDHAFIYSSFLRSYRDSPSVYGIPNTLYFAKQHQVIEEILADRHTHAIVACSSADPTQIYGYILGQWVTTDKGVALCVHWVYCKQPFRNCGIAKKLYDTLLAIPMPAPVTAIYYTHRVKTVERLLKSLPQVIYNPFILQGV